MVSVNLYSNNSKDLENFLTSFYNSSFNINNDLKWKHEYNNPIEITDIISALIDNYDKFKITMWITLDNDIYINVTEKNADILIKYMFERYPY